MPLSWQSAEKMAYGRLGCLGACVDTPMGGSPSITVHEEPRPLWYLADCSLGNSWRLVASSLVRNTGTIWTFGGSAAPRITKQHRQGSALGQGRWKGSHRSWGDVASPTPTESSALTHSSAQNKIHKTAATVFLPSEEGPLMGSFTSCCGER